MATKVYKSDRRGKYPGIKAHLDEADCQELLEWYKHLKEGTKSSKELMPEGIQFAKRLAKTVKEVLAENPDLLEERTPEQVREALEKDQKKIQEQLATMKSGDDWKKVK